MLNSIILSRKTVIFRSLPLLVVLCFGVLATPIFANDDVFVGTVEKIDAETKKIYLESEDGVVRAFKWTRKSTAHGINAARLWTKDAVKKGDHVVVRVGKEAGEDVVKGLHWFGSGVAGITETTVRHLGKGSRKVEVAVVGKGKEIFELSEHAVLSTGSKVWHRSKDIEKTAVKESKAVVHYVERDGKKVVHYVEHKVS